MEQQESQFDQSGVPNLRAKVAYRRNRLRSPLDGMVLRRDGEVGEIVGPTDVLFWEFGPPLPKQVVAEINEEEITKIAIGQKAYLRTEAFAGRQLHAEVSQITPKVRQPTDFSHLLAATDDSPLRIGMTVEVNIVSS